MIYFGLLKSNSLILLLSLCFGHNDNIRWKVLKIILRLAKLIISNLKLNRLNISNKSNNNISISDKVINYLEQVNSLLTNEFCMELSDKIYSQEYDLDNWVHKLLNYTPKSLVLKLTDNELLVLQKLCKFSNDELYQFENRSIKISGGIEFPTNWLNHCLNLNALDKNDLDVFMSFKANLNNLIQNLNNNNRNNSNSKNRDNAFFIKLSSRSPKDSKILKRKTDHLKKELKQNINTTNNSIYYKITNEEEKQDFINDEAQRTAYKCYYIDEALNLLITSQRIEEDIDTYNKFCNSNNSNTNKNTKSNYNKIDSLNLNSSLSYVIRNYIENMPPFLELRGFVCFGNLNALTQYQDDKSYPWLSEHKNEIFQRVFHFYNSKLKTLLLEAHYPHAVIDFGIVIDRNEIVDDLVVIELNSFGMRSGAGCFTWDNEKDYEIMLNGPEEFRIM